MRCVQATNTLIPFAFYERVYLILIMTLSIKIKNEKVKELLENLAAMNLIEITDEANSTATSSKERKEKTVTHLASEASLAKTWSNEEEDKAWQDL